MASSSSINSKVSCYCNKESPLRVAKTESHRGERFYGCGNYGLKGKQVCSFFQWAENEEEDRSCLKSEEFYRDFYEERIKELKEEIRGLRCDLENEKKLKTEYRIRLEFCMQLFKYFVVCSCGIYVLYIIMK